VRGGDARMSARSGHCRSRARWPTSRDQHGRSDSAASRHPRSGELRKASGSTAPHRHRGTDVTEAEQPSRGRFATYMVGTALCFGCRLTGRRTELLLEQTIRYAALHAKVPVYVTENGIATEGDVRRVEYIRRALAAALVVARHSAGPPSVAFVQSGMSVVTPQSQRYHIRPRASANRRSLAMATRGLRCRSPKRAWIAATKR
jgi:hypothetical protein